MKHSTITSLTELGSVTCRDSVVVVKVGNAENRVSNAKGDAVRLELTTVKDGRTRIKTFRMATAVPHSLRWLSVVTGDRKLVGLVAELLEDDR